MENAIEIKRRSSVAFNHLQKQTVIIVTKTIHVKHVPTRLQFHGFRMNNKTKWDIQFILFYLFVFFIFEYNVRWISQVLSASVLKQYTKSVEIKEIAVLK